MKKLQLLFFAFFAASLILAGTVEKTYYFGDPKVITTGEFQMIYLENTQIFGFTGEPALPYQSVQLLLPPGEKAVSFEFTGEEEFQLPGTYHIYPQQPSRPLSAPGNGEFAYNESVYSASSEYPSEPNGKLITSYMNGYAFALSTFTPVKYNPATGIVSIYKKVTITITTAQAGESVAALNNLKQTKEIRTRVNSFAQNPEMMYGYPSVENKTGEYQLLIITTNQYSGNFQNLIDIYLKRGITTQIVTKETINSNGTGQDLQDKIRNYIKQEYQDHSVEYVLLGGDVELIPYRGFYCYVVSGGGYEDSNIPADLYYSGLDGNWNTDADGNWGEPGEDDLLPDIAVGRFSFSNLTELNSMMHKTIYYQDYPVLGEFTKATLAGEWLYSDPETYGSDYLELLIGHHTDNGYETWGIPEDYTFFKLYEENQSWGGSDLMAQINAGRQYIHHVGHANETYVAYWSNSDITNANFSGANGTTHNYTIFHSHGCICGAFDVSDCIMEKMASIDNFAVAVVGNSRYGWFNEGQTEGPSAHLHREMMDALYHEKINHLGATFAEAKIQTAPWVTAPGQWEEGALRWNFYDINILGDPTLSLWTGEPVSIDVTYPNTLVVGATSANVTVMSGGSPVENFTCALIFNDQLMGTGVTNASGNAVLSFEALPTPGDATLIVSGYNCLPAEYPVTIVPGTTAYMVYSAHALDDSQGNGNSLIDFGETLTMDLTLENAGALEASNVSATLSCSDPDVTITDNYASFGNVAVGGTPTVTDAFAFTVSDDIQDQHVISFNLAISWDGDSGSYSFDETANAPALSIGNLVIDDSGSGNGDGLLDPGETADVIISVSNSGHCASPASTGNLGTTSADISITTASVNVGVINTGETKDATFTIVVDAQASPGTSVDLDFDLASGNYGVQNTFYITIGLIVEDFESGDFSSFAWQQGGSANWIITSSGAYEGEYSAKSGAISDEQTSDLSLDMEVSAAGEISFFRKVSSEDSYDYLRFYIDDVMKDEWSGEADWAEAVYAVTAGSHTFRWSYEKDYSVAGGSDCGWIDNIIFPASTTSTSIGKSVETVCCVYPNPNEGCFFVNTGSYSGKLKITVTNVLNAVVFAGQREANKRVSVDLNDLPGGIYFVTLEGDGLEQTVKMVIK
jgi:hypothetical protein